MLDKRLLFAWLLLISLLLTSCRINLTGTDLAYGTGGDAAKGPELLDAYGCGACHTIPGVPGANSTVGPPLNKWADRLYIAGALPNRSENLVQWIIDPQAIEPGTVMPNLSVTEEDARHMSAYLYSLR